MHPIFHSSYYKAFYSRYVRVYIINIFKDSVYKVFSSSFIFIIIVINSQRFFFNFLIMKYMKPKEGTIF